MEKSLVLIKPDAVERNLIGEIICFYEKEDLKITALRMLTASKEIADKHYAEHKGKPYYDELITFITRSPLCAMVVEGENAIAKVRKTNGNTDPSKADKNTIRGSFGISKTENSVHSSDSPDNAKKEIALWF
ncbi:nucleoside-diphosphate kinase [Clostridium botulinum]|uniref:Nucleoside diphosphate kinase n=1 Tax=Clostridium botulinum C/D str. DC5 TaxID=1443128 RepID=A0A0A0IBA4_CLOBO|nr:nucleoside-diphosphate kinase [Clostridium botulinum]KEI01160.1 nucleoside diphosphate kinase [Clostridium botulinum C/D str. BKT75002]KEI13361.1 nucleoside diphosphate kinase [Clostridium botulinum C/D str. BKT2873]KGM95795.1 nucleoside diphosphate kinase [Clostridium botulinum D str. CCUG 7971]KGM98714.1 nucleoside diphosphate kinase [Clostridium botulinum C/D str. DC5]KOC47155.1 nucleoside diphosphate kinase [Clostridium botulinum]